MAVPTAGFLYEPANGAIHPVVGLPGAWMVAPALPPALPMEPVQTLRFARRGFALSVQTSKAAGRTSHRRNPIVPLDEAAPTLSILTGLASSAPQSNVIEGALAADGIILNRREDAALLVSSRTNQAQWILGLPANPRLGATVDLPFPAGTGSLRAALSDDASSAVIGTAQGAGPLYRVTPDGAAVAAGNATVAAVVFASDGSTFVVDAETRQLLKMPASGGLVAIAPLPDSLGSDLQMQWAGTHLMIAGNTPQAACVEVTQQTMTTLDLPQPATHLQPFGPDQMLALGDVQSKQPVYVVEPGNTCGEVIRFIPPAAEGREQ